MSMSYGRYAVIYYDFDAFQKRCVFFEKRPRFSKIFDNCRSSEIPYLVLGNSIVCVLRKEYLIPNCKDIKYRYFLRRIPYDEFVFLICS